MSRLNPGEVRCATIGDVTVVMRRDVATIGDVTVVMRRDGDTYLICAAGHTVQTTDRVAADAHFDALVTVFRATELGAWPPARNRVSAGRWLLFAVLLGAATAGLIMAAVIDSWALLVVALDLCLAAHVCQKWAQQGGTR